MGFKPASRRISCLVLLSLTITVLVCSVRCDNEVSHSSSYPSSFSILKGTHSSGNIPTSVQTVDADYLVTESGATETIASEHPLQYVLGGSTSLISGDVSNLATNDSSHMAFRSYANTTQDVRYGNSSDGQSSTTSGWYSDKVVLTFTPNKTGDYLVIASAELRGSSAMYDVRVRMTIDGTTYANPTWQPDEAGMWESFFTSKVTSLNDSLHTIKIQYSSENFAQTATIRRARIVAFELSDFASNEAEAEQAVASGPSYMDVVTTTFTPTIAGTYLVLATAEIRAGSTSDSIYTRLQIDGATKDIMITEGETTSDYEVFAAHNVTAFSAAAHTIGIQASREGFGTAYVRRARIVAVRLGDYYVLQTAGSEEVSSTSSTSWVNKTVLTFTPSVAGNYLVIATAKMNLNTSANGNQPAINFTIDGTEYGYWRAGLSDATDYLTFATMANVSLSASFHTFKIAYETTNINYTASIRDARIVIVGPTCAREYVSEVEFTGASDTYGWKRLTWTLDCAWTAGSVNVVLQLYDFAHSNYPASGNGYLSYVSSSVSNSEESKSQVIVTDSADFRNGTGHWRMRIRGTKVASVQFDLMTDFVEFEHCCDECEASTEFTFSGITNATLTGLNLTAVCQHTAAGVRIAIQVWNHSSSAYATTGEAYLAYLSTGMNESKTLSLNTNPHFYVSSGTAKMKISGFQRGSSFQQRTNQIMLSYSYVVPADASDQPFDWTWVIIGIISAMIGLVLALIFVFRRRKNGNTSDKKINPFSASFGVTHEGLTGKKVLLEIDPRADYQTALFDFANEAKNNGEKLFIFTSANSPLHSNFTGTGTAKFFLLASEAYSSKENTSSETFLPVSNLSVLLNELTEIQKTKTRKAKTVIFDNISDVVLLCGFEKTYKFIRWLLETRSSPKTTTLFVFNPAAHDPRKSSSIRGLFQSRLAYTKNGPKIGTL